MKHTMSTYTPAYYNRGHPCGDGGTEERGGARGRHEEEGVRGGRGAEHAAEGCCGGGVVERLWGEWDGEGANGQGRRVEEGGSYAGRTARDTSGTPEGDNVTQTFRRTHTWHVHSNRLYAIRRYVPVCRAKDVCHDGQLPCEKDILKAPDCFGASCNMKKTIIARRCYVHFR